MAAVKVSMRTSPRRNGLLSVRAYRQVIHGGRTPSERLDRGAGTLYGSSISRLLLLFRVVCLNADDIFDLLLGISLFC